MFHFNTMAKTSDRSRIRKIQRLGQLLIRLDIIRPNQWDRVHHAGSIGDIMDALENETAWWSNDHPAISMFQRRRIAAGEFNGNRDLDRELRVNNFLIVDELGKGGMGYVHKAWSINFGSLAAIKRTGSGHHLNRDRLQREAQILQLLDDPVIAKYLSWEPVEDGGGFVLAMEYISGRSLRDYLSQHQQVGVQQTVDWGLTLLQGLKHAHSRKVVHRDIKPQNIMVTDETPSELKILDFGLGRVRGEVSNALNLPELNFALTQQAEALGTFQYMSPEQWRDAGSVTGAADIYSLGCTLYEMLAGRTPFGDSKWPRISIDHDRTPPPDIRMFRSDVPDRLRATIHQMLAKKPAERGTPEELINQLREKRLFFQSPVSEQQATSTSDDTVNRTAPGELPHHSQPEDPANGFQNPAHTTPVPLMMPQPGWKRRLIPQSALSTAAGCVEPKISGVEIYERLASPAWMAFGIGILILFCIAWLTMG